MSVKRVVIAGAGSGVGKTTISTGIMSLLSKRYRVQGFKVGPDFIDPMFHTAATGRPSRNLDSFFMDHDTLKGLFGWATRDADLAIIEGVRGLYDGLTSTGDTGSTAEIAKVLDAPVILVINARSLAKSAAAHVLGFKMLDKDVRIEGVILNQVSGARHREKAVQAVEELTGTPVVGVVERRSDRLPERHLGLVTLDEEDQTKNSLHHMESMVADVDLDRVMGIAEKAGDAMFPVASPFPKGEKAGVKVAVPRDRAFCFYYAENLESIEAAGGKIEYFQPTDGGALPDADAYYLGGGYPELYGKELGSNQDFTEGLRTAADDGKLIYGECGGLMTMCRSIRNGEEERAMAGIFPYDAELTDGRQGLAYVRARGTADNFLFPDMDIRGHEFHYSRLTPTPSGPYGFDVLRGTGINGRQDGLIKGKCMGTYMHQHALANKEWGLRIVRSASR